MKKRDNSIDIVKGWGIILVIWGHTSHFLFNEIYAFHMPLFFFLSGCFFSPKLSFGGFIKKKFRQLIVPYWLFIILSCLYYWGLLYVTGRLNTECFSSLYDLFPYDNEIINTPLWFFFALFWMSILYYLLRKLTNNNFVILGITVALHLLEFFFTQVDLALPAYMGRSLRELVYMHLGFWLYEETKLAFINKNTILKKYLYIAVCIVVFVFLFTIQKQIDGYLWSLMTIFTAFVGIVFSLFLAGIIRYKLLIVVFSYLGTHTLCLFSIHLPLYEISRPIAKMLFDPNNIYYDITSFLVVLVLSIIDGEVLMLIFPKILGKSVLTGKLSLSIN